MPEFQRVGAARHPVRHVLAVSAIAAAAAAALVACDPVNPDAAAAAAPPAPPVTVARAVERAVPQASAHVGRVEAVQRIELRPRVAGQIEAVLFKEGDRVRAGDALFRLDARPFEAALAQADAALQLATAREAQARGEAERARQLADAQAISAELLERRLSAHAEAAAHTAAARAAVRAAQLNLDFAVVRAPIDGRIGRALVTAGNLVGAGEAQPPLATLVSPTLHVHFDVADAAVLSRLAAERPLARWRAQVRDAQDDRELAQAPLDFIDNEMARGSGSVRVRARVDGGASTLVPGQFVRVRLVSDAQAPSIVVPDRAIGTDQGHRYVMVVKPDQEVEYRIVRTGSLQGEWRVVTEGLRAGEQVIVSGLMRVRPGMKVQPQLGAGHGPAAAAAAGGSTT